MLTACVLAGYIKERNLKRRCRIIEDFINAIRTLETEIRFSRDNLSDIYCRFNAKTEAGAVFCAAGQSMMNRKGMEEAWIEAVNIWLDPAVISEENRQILMELGREMGRCDVEGEIDRLEYYRERLKRGLETEQTEYDSRSGLYRKGSVLIGVLLVILLI